MNKSLALMVVLAMLTACTNAIDDAVTAYAKGDYETAVKILRPLAEQGRASAQFNLGQMYRQGYGVVQDYTVAIIWFKLAANQGHDIAQYNLGVMYEDGVGVEKNHNEAVRWFKLAADQGLTPAKARLISWTPQVETLLPPGSSAEIISEDAASASDPAQEDISVLPQPASSSENLTLEENSTPLEPATTASSPVQKDINYISNSDKEANSSAKDEINN